MVWALQASDRMVLQTVELRVLLCCHCHHTGGGTHRNTVFNLHKIMDKV